MAYEITEIFKKESSSVYFIPFASFSPQEKISAKGKLLDCYRQRRRDFIKSGVIKRKEKSCSSSHSGSDSLSPRPSTSVQAAVEQLAADDENEIKDKLLWLKNCCTPWETVENNWSITTKARFNLLQSELTIQQYYADFKALNQPGGIFLVCIWCNIFVFFMYLFIDFCQVVCVLDYEAKRSRVPNPQNIIVYNI